MGDAHQLAVCDVHVLEGVGGDAWGGTREVEGVHDGFEGVVDLVRDAGGEASGAGQHLAAQEGFFGLLSGGVVGADEQVADDVFVCVAQGGDGDDGRDAAAILADVG